MDGDALLRGAGPAAGLAGSRLPPAQTVVPLSTLVERLSRSLLLSAVAGVCAALGLVLVYLLVLPAPWVLVLLAVTLLHQGAVWTLRRVCRRGAVGRAAVLSCVADWGVILTALLIVPACAPALVPIVIARIVSTLPYLDRPALRRLIGVSLGVGVLVGVLSRVDLLGVQEQAPHWVITAFVAFFVPLGIGIVGLDLWQHSATLLETAQRALRANTRLQASRAALAEQADELRRSRARLVVAADTERRRVERDLHDGAQQTLVGLCLGMSLLAEREAEGSRLRAELLRLEGVAQDALTELRELAHGVYPPLLAAQGLAPALEAVLRRCRLPVRASIGTVPRRPPAQEAAVYFCCREALQNAEKHAGPAAAVQVRLSERDGELRFSVSDTGRGFDGAAVGGHGLTNMRDRIAAVGGTLAVESTPHGGTRITGSLPAAADPAAGAVPAGSSRPA